MVLSIIGERCLHTECKSVTWLWTIKIAQYEADWYESPDNVIAVVVDDVAL